MSQEVTYRQAITRALADELEHDQSVFLIGEDIGAAGGAFKVTDGLHAQFGGDRVFDTPISEQAIVGTAIGAAIKGLRPVAEIMFGDFAGVCHDQIVNEMAKYRYMTGGQVTLPVTVRMATGAGGGFGAQHSQTVENWFVGVIGLKLVVPGTPADAYGLLRAAIRDPNPVLFCEHKNLFNLKGELADTPQEIELGRADVVRPGRDVTVVATQLMRHRALATAESLASEGIEIEVIDPRTLVPFDLDTIYESLERTNRLIVVEEASHGGSWGATLGLAGCPAPIRDARCPARCARGRRHARSLRETTRGGLATFSWADRGRSPNHGCLLMAELRMPRLLDSMEEGTIVRWLKSDGDEVSRGEEIVEIETDKAVMAYEAEWAGVLTILADEGTSVPVGAPIAAIDVAARMPVPPVSPAVTAEPAAPPAPPTDVAFVRLSASPVARRAAAALGIRVDKVSGSGPRGRILKADVVAAASRAPQTTVTVPAGATAGARADASEGAGARNGPKGATTVEVLSRVQQTVARRMSESRATVPDFAVQADVDMSSAVELRAQIKSVSDPAPSLNDFVVKAVALALRRHPRVNGSYHDGEYELYERINVGVAVATENGLSVPTVLDADKRSLLDLAAETRRLAARVRDGRITPPELGGATFTVSNLGIFGIDRFAGIVNRPQAAILCVGAVTKRPAVGPDEIIVARDLMTLTLVSDHRILYGADASRFLADVRATLQAPLGILLDHQPTPEGP